MTYCLGIKVKSGLVAIADTRLTSGVECSIGKKVFTHQKNNHSLFVMCSGLRSVRDKVITYFKEDLEINDNKYNKLYKAVNGLSDQLRKVADEDKANLTKGGLFFNLFAIIGGQLENDEEHKLFLLYPEGNWIEIGEDGSPFIIIGNSGYGKPILNRTITPDSTLSFSLKTGFLSFDSTRVSANDVDFPIDVVIYEKNSYNLVEQRIERNEVSEVTQFWQQTLSSAIDKIPEGWMDKVFRQLHEA
ncbi:MAG: peptidase [Bacteroidetes bacterium]|nr:MAG: peptidase [Bacteroidota bacterium]